MRELVPGERAAIGAQAVLALDQPINPPLALALIALDRARRICRDFPPIDTLRRELRAAARFDETGALRLDLASFPDSVDRLALAAFLTTGPGGGSAFQSYQRIELRAGEWRFPIPLASRSDTALVLVELYRHGGGWRVSANGQGFVHGLPALADAFGRERGWAERLVRPEPPDRSSEDRPSASDRVGGAASGSGVAVDPHHVLTNAHVVEGARATRVLGEGRALDADLVFADPRNDLALLRVQGALPSSARFRGSAELHLGEEVVALGFPLQGLLGSGPQASGGNIAALSGVGNDTSLFQFTAPIASGNSGGPILDAGGLLIGIVCSSLNIERIRAAGNSAENVNFGIKGTTVRSFLDAYGLVPAIDDQAQVVARAAIVRAARPSLYRIACTC